LEAANTSTAVGGSRAVPTCVCRDKHYYADCYIINDKHPKRPKGYKPSPEKLKKVTEARKDPKVEQRIKIALEKRAKYVAKNSASSSSGPIQLDDGLPPSNSNSLVVGLGTKLGDSPYRGGSSSGIELLECSDQSSIGDSSIVHADNNVNPTGTLVALPLGEEVHNDLLTRWIVDPGFNAHVINSETWEGWTRERENDERRTINTGSGTVEITAWGRVELVVNTPCG
jgi:hypothetical protein